MWVSLNGTLSDQTFRDSYAMDLQLSPDGRYLYCADVTNFRVVVVNTAAAQVVGSVRVGRYPYALAVSGQRVYVANIGMFEYSPVPEPGGRSRFDKRGLTFPPFGFPSSEFKASRSRSSHSRSWRPERAEFLLSVGLGCVRPGAPEGSLPHQDRSPRGSACRQRQRRSEAVLPTSLWLGVTTCGSPMATTTPSNVLDLATARIVRKTRLQPSPLTARLRGVGPSGMALSPDGRRLYVAESGINAIAVLEPMTLRVLGHLPTAWYPYRVAVSHDGKSLAVIRRRLR